MACGKEWTTKEIAVLRQIHQSGIATTEQMHLLPGRSLASVRQTMLAQGWGNKPHGKSSVKKRYETRKGKMNFERFLAIVEEFGPITMTDVSARMRLDRNTVYQICKFAHRGPEKMIHVADHTESGVETKYAQRKFAIGNLPDVESNSLTARQRRRIAKEEAALEFERMKERDFAPRRDPLVAALFGSHA